MTTPNERILLESEKMLLEENNNLKLKINSLNKIIKQLNNKIHIQDEIIEDSEFELNELDKLYGSKCMWLQQKYNEDVHIHNFNDCLCSRCAPDICDRRANGYNNLPDISDNNKYNFWNFFLQ
jgi:hypothetical protein